MAFVLFGASTFICILDESGYTHTVTAYVLRVRRMRIIMNPLRGMCNVGWMEEIIKRNLKNCDHVSVCVGVPCHQSFRITWTLYVHTCMGSIMIF